MKLSSLLMIGVLGVFFANTKLASARVFPSQAQGSNLNQNFNALSGGPVLYYGGPVISHAQVIMVLWGDKVSPRTKSEMPGFYSSILNSTYMDWLHVYNTVGVRVQGGTHAPTNQTIGRGTYLQAIQIKPRILTGLVDDEQIKAELERQVLAHVLPAPTADTLYMIHFPPRLTITMHDEGKVTRSCQQFCAYHQGFKTKSGGSIFYGVIPDLDGVACLSCASGDALARITSCTSHELIEAVTDAFPTPGTHPNYPQAWNNVRGDEVGDLCVDHTGFLRGKSANYVVQQEWDNTKNACTTGNYVSQ